MQAENIIALDVGERRVGVAIAHKIARLPRPLTTLQRGADFWDELKNILANESVGMIVVGMPRNLSGQETQQTKSTLEFVNELERLTSLPVKATDEALTSRQAEAELKASGKQFAKGDIDALAAVYILQDFIDNNLAASSPQQI